MASNLLIICSDDEDDTEENSTTESREWLPSQSLETTESREWLPSQSLETENVTDQKIGKEISAPTEISCVEEVKTAACGYSSTFITELLHQKQTSERDTKILSTPEAVRSIEKALSDMKVQAVTDADLTVAVSLSLIQEEKMSLPRQGKLDGQTQIDLESKYLVDIEVSSGMISIKGLKNVSLVKDEIEKILTPKSELFKNILTPESELRTLHIQFNKGQSRCYKRNPDFISKCNLVQSNFLKDTRESGSHFDIRKDNKCLVIEIRGGESLGLKYKERLEDLKREMWDGKVDLYRISKEESDVALMSHGIQKNQKQFINMAECQLQCGILVENTSKNVKGLHYQSQPASHSMEGEDLLSEFPSVEGAYSPETSGWGREYSRGELSREPTVRVVKRDVTLHKAKCLVNFFDKESGLSTRGRIFGLFMKRGGEELNMSLQSAYNRHANVTITKGCGSLKCEYVCHVALPKYDDRRGKSSLQTRPLSENLACKNGDIVIITDVVKYSFIMYTAGKELRQIMQDCFVQCKRQNLYEIAFPALGVGQLLGYPPQEVARLLVSESVSHAERERKWKITFAIYDETHYTLFKQEADQNKQVAVRREHSAPSLRGNSHVLYKRSSAPDLHNVKGEYKRSPKRNHSNLVPVIELHIFAISKERGEAIRSKLSELIKEKFLHEHTIERIGELSGQNARKMYEIGQKWNVFVSIDKGRNQISLKGSTDNVSKAVAEMEYLCTKPSQEPHTMRKENKYDRGTDAYWKHMLKEPPVPSYWKNFKDGKSFFDVVKGLFTSTEKRYQVDAKTFNAIRKLVERTFKPELVGKGADARNLGHKKIHVQKVEIIENMDVYKDYNEKRRKMLKKCIEKRGSCFPNKLQKIPRKANIQNVLGKGAIYTEKEIDGRLTTDIISELNEVYLFHGTKEDFVENIVSKGMDPKHGSDNGMFGRGIYCAESSTKADQYADDKDKRGQKGKMFLMRLLLGNIFVTEQDKKYKQPPCNQCLREDCVAASHDRFDSVVGVKQQTGGLFREFVVYDRDQCYPEYLITYTRL